MNEKIIATKPRLVESGSRWYIYFSVRNSLTGKLHPVKIEKGFKQLGTPEEKRDFGKKLVREYNAKLKAGWTPWANDEYIFDDQILYKTEADSYGSRRRRSKASVRLYSSKFLSFKQQSLKPKGYSSYCSKFRIFTQWLEKNGYADYDINAIDNKIILLFFEYLISERKLDKVTVQGYKVRLNAMFGWLLKDKIILKNPIYNIPTGRKLCDHSPRPILQVDINELLDKIKSNDPQLYLACLIQFFCAIRPGTELRLLKIKHIDLWAGSIHVNVIDSKTGHGEHICMPNQLKELMTDTYRLQNYESELYVFSQNGIPGRKPLGRNNMRMRFNKYRDELHLSKEYKFYSFKHTGAGMMMNSGDFNLKELMEHLRHTDINSTYHYIRRYKGNSSDKIRNQFPNPSDTFSIK